MDAARDDYDILCTDLWLARERLAGLVVEQHRLRECAMRGVAR